MKHRILMDVVVSDADKRWCDPSCPQLLFGTKREFQCRISPEPGYYDVDGIPLRTWTCTTAPIAISKEQGESHETVH